MVGTQVMLAGTQVAPRAHRERMADRASDYFEVFVNSQAARPDAAERTLLPRVTVTTQRVIPRSQVRWAGSQRKDTAIVGSDLDMCVESAEPVTEALRRGLRAALQAGLGREAVIRTHVVRVAAGGGVARLDIAFATAVFGSRPLPEIGAFSGHPGRQTAARALKLWTRQGRLPRVGAWAWEAVVVHLDAPSRRDGLELFLRVVGWLDTATPASIEGVLRHANHGHWNPVWSPDLPGTLEALRNHAKVLQRRFPAPEGWQSPTDAGVWLCG